MATQPPASCEKRHSAVEGLAKNPLHDKGPTDGTDSGYGSLGSTLDVESSELGEFELEHKVSRRLFSRSKKTKLRPFDQEISKAVQNRFSDLTELFGPSLYSFLAKKRVVYNAISIKLKVLGKDERSAKPWVVVQCDGAASKPIKNFFDQPEVKSQYRAGDAEPDLPSFEVIIHPRAPVSLATSDLTSVYGNSWAAVDTLCGRIIKIGILDEPRIATLGGVIEVENSPGEFILHGLTAGHILTKEPAIRHDDRRESPSTNIAAYSSCETAPTHLKSELLKVDDDLAHDSGHSQEQEGGDFAVGCERDKEEFEIDLAVDIDKATEGPTSFQGSSLDLTTQGSQQQSWSKIGIISQTSRGMLGMGRLGPDHTIGPDHDWALVSIAPDLYQPNLLAGQPDMELTELSGEVHKSEGSRAVVLASDIGGLKHGTLSFSPSFLMLGQAKLFTKTYNLLLHDVPAPNIGESGSWVVDEQSYGVYGHLVASDALGEAYVVPFDKILLDIRHSLGAMSIRLPSKSETFRRHIVVNTTLEGSVPPQMLQADSGGTHLSQTSQADSGYASLNRTPGSFHLVQAREPTRPSSPFGPVDHVPKNPSRLKRLLKSLFVRPTSLRRK